MPPEHLFRITCADRYWKKKVHEPRLLTAVSWKLRLARDCARLDKFLKGLQGSVDDETLNRLFVLNTDVLYKARKNTNLSGFCRCGADSHLAERGPRFPVRQVCKRLEKRSGVPAMQHYRTILKKHQYAFTRCSQETLLPNLCYGSAASGDTGAPDTSAEHARI